MNQNLHRPAEVHVSSIGCFLLVHFGVCRPKFLVLKRRARSNLNTGPIDFGFGSNNAAVVLNYLSTRKQSTCFVTFLRYIVSL